MAKIHYLVPERSVQTTETFHAIRRTDEGMLYYTKVNKNENVSIDFEAGNPTDKNGGRQLPTNENYVEDTIKLQTGQTQIFVGDGGTTTFTLSAPALDDSRIAVFVDGNLQQLGNTYSYTSPTVTFKIAPKNLAQVAVGKIDKTTQSNPEDFYYQYVFEDGDATYFIDSNGYFVKRENFAKSLTRIATDDFSTFESTQTVNSTTWRS
jgi:hypothetical protein